MPALTDLPDPTHPPHPIDPVDPARLSRRGLLPTLLGALLGAVLVAAPAAAPGSAAPAARESPATSATSVTGGGPGWQPGFPVRAAFYYPWFPETFGSPADRYTHFHPTSGWYDSSATRVLDAHVDAMLRAGIHVGIASWWDPGSRTDGRFPALLAAAAGRRFRWTLYVEAEGQGDPTPAAISRRLTYIRSHYAGDPAYLRVGGRPVVFVYADPGDRCGMVRRWQRANRGRFHLVLKDFPGYTTCRRQPADWHQYAPAEPVQTTTTSVSVSPGFWHADESTPRLTRSPRRFAADVRAMAASGKRWQLVTTFNEWGEGTAVEPAREWASDSRQGRYLDILRRVLRPEGR